MPDTTAEPTEVLAGSIESVAFHNPSNGFCVLRIKGSGMVRGIGFRSADAIAARLGIEPTVAIRLRAGINYALLEASGEGHCGLPTAEPLKRAADLQAVEQPGGERPTSLSADTSTRADQLAAAPTETLASGVGSGWPC